MKRTKAEIKDSIMTHKHLTQVKYLDIAQLKPDPANPHKHSDRQLKALAKSIKAFGFVVPVAIDSTNQLVAGHARLEAAKKLGMTEVPVISLEHLSPDQIKAFMIADNRLSELATWDDKLLGQQLQSLTLLDLDFDLEATGFTIGEIDLRIESMDESTIDEEADRQIFLEGPAVTQPDDLWIMGEHRLLCGSALEAASYSRLMEGKLAGMIFTDPPYNVRIDGHVGGLGQIRHREFAMATGEMSEDEFTGFLASVFNLLTRHSRDGSIHQVFMDWRHLQEILSAGREVYNDLLNVCVWAKTQGGMGSLYRSQHELVMIFKHGKQPHQNNIQLGRFGRYRSNVWNYTGIQGMRSGEEGDLLQMHPTVKPVRLVADALLDCSRRGDLILDPFLGSGTTLLAAERVGRRCRGIELDPLYVDTAIERFQNLTGLDAILETTGQTFTERKGALNQESEFNPKPEINHVA
jgi:DNA modification methylase